MLEENITDRILITEKMREEHKRIIGFVIVGNSMYPTLGEGDVVFINPEMTEIINGKMYACIYDGEQATVKYVKKVKKSIYLIPENKEHDPTMINKEQEHEFFMIGRVIGILKSNSVL